MKIGKKVKGCGILIKMAIQYGYQMLRCPAFFLDSSTPIPALRSFQESVLLE